jgi:hypothetical protein
MSNPYINGSRRNVFFIAGTRVAQMWKAGQRFFCELLTIQKRANTGGTVDGTADVQVFNSDSITVQATPSIPASGARYRFLRWDQQNESGGNISANISTANPYTFSPGNSWRSPNSRIIAQFQENISLSATVIQLNSSGSGTTNFGAERLIDLNATTGNITATPTATSGTVNTAGHYRNVFTGWFRRNTSTGALSSALSTAATQNFTIDTNYRNPNNQLAAQFVEEIYIQTLNTGGTGSGTVTSSAYRRVGETFAIVATASTGSVFTRWEVSSNGTSWSTVTGANASYTIPAISTAQRTTNNRYRAIFTQNNYTVTVQRNPDTNWQTSVTASATPSSVVPGSATTLSATNTGTWRDNTGVNRSMRFLNWTRMDTGTVISTSNSLSWVPPSNITVRANWTCS